jgi:putative oxidoreductase
MKTAYTLARILLGLLFLVFGLNGFLHFISMPPPSGLAGQYVGTLFASHYLVAVFLIEVTSSFLLLVNRFVPAALVLLGPVLANILLFHFLMAPDGLPLALVATLLWAVVFWRVRTAFAGIFRAQLKV